MIPQVQRSAAGQAPDGPDTRYPIGLTVWYFNKIQFPPVRRPRAALVTGPGDSAGHFNVHIFPDPLTDIADRKHPVMRTQRNVPLLDAWPTALPEGGFLLLAGYGVPEEKPGQPTKQVLPSSETAEIKEPGTPEAKAEAERHIIPVVPPKKPAEEPAVVPPVPPKPVKGPIAVFLEHGNFLDYKRKLASAGATVRKVTEQQLDIQSKTGFVTAVVTWVAPSDPSAGPGGYCLMAYRGGDTMEVIVGNASSGREVGRVMAHACAIGVAAANAADLTAAGAATAKALHKAKGQSE